MSPRTREIDRPEVRRRRHLYDRGAELQRAGLRLDDGRVGGSKEVLRAVPNEIAGITLEIQERAARRHLDGAGWDRDGRFGPRRRDNRCDKNGDRHKRTHGCWSPLLDVVHGLPTIRTATLQ